MARYLIHNNVSNYAGESDAKRVTRGIVWMELLDCREPSKARPALVLASSFGGDIRVLTGLGYEQSSIVAADLDASAIETCRTTFPEVRYHCSDVASVAAKVGFVGNAFLDFCGGCSPGIINTVRSTEPYVKGRLAVAVMMGREDYEKEYFGDLRNTTLGSVSDWVSGIEQCERESGINREVSTSARTRVMALAEAIYNRRRLRSWYVYKGHRVPMVVAVFGAPFEPPVETINAWKFGPNYDRLFSVTTRGSDSKWLKSTTLDAFFCLPSGTVAAWRAVETKQERLDIDGELKIRTWLQA